MLTFSLPNGACPFVYHNRKARLVIEDGGTLPIAEFMAFMNAINAKGHGIADKVVALIAGALDSRATKVLVRHGDVAGLHNQPKPRPTDWRLR